MEVLPRVGLGAKLGLGLALDPTYEKAYDTSTRAGLLRRLQARYQSTWYCKQCGRFCSNCCGRSCTKCCIRLPPIPVDPATKYLKPAVMGTTHQDSLFQNAFKAKSYYVVHPEWNSEVVADPQKMPLNRPPWPWEQPRYRVNMQVPITYDSPVQMEAEDLFKKPEEKEEGAQPDFAKELPPLSYHLTQAYRSTHPEYVVRY